MKRRGSSFSEVDLGRALVPWLREQDFEVYQEVEAGGALDIAAVRGSTLWAIELKLALTPEAVLQAHRWHGAATWTTVACLPCYRGTPSQHLCKWYARANGIGILEARLGVTMSGDEIRGWDWEVMPRMFRRPGDSIRRHLREEHKTFAEAGSPGGSRWSPWKETCENLRKVVLQEPGLSMKDAMERTKHHYSTASTARSSMAKWIVAKRVPGVEARMEGRGLKLYPVAVESVA